MKNKDLILEALKELNSQPEPCANAIDLLERFIRSNEVNLSDRFDLFNYVNQKDYVSAYAGVSHVEGQRIATDGNILVVLSDQKYSSDLEGVTVYKNGCMRPYVPFSWKNVIPIQEKSTSSIVLDRSTILELYRKWQLARKTNAPEVVARIHGYYFSPEHLYKAFRFAEYVLDYKLYVFGEHEAYAKAAIFSSTGSVCVFASLNPAIAEKTDRIVTLTNP